MNGVVAQDWNAIAQRVEEVRDLGRTFAARARDHFGSRLRDIRLFGSAARGDWQEDSDVDVLVLLDIVRLSDREWIAEQVARLGILGAGIPISTVTLTEDQFKDLQRRELLFAQEVGRDGVLL